MPQILIDLIKYFTELSSEKALRFLLGTVAISLGSWIFIIQRNNAKAHAAFKAEYQAQLLKCEFNVNRRLIERDSLFTLLYNVKVESLNNELKAIKSILAESKKDVKTVKKLADNIVDKSIKLN
jgi:hypothetical protein